MTRTCTRPTPTPDLPDEGSAGRSNGRSERLRPRCRGRRSSGIPIAAGRTPTRTERAPMSPTPARRPHPLVTTRVERPGSPAATSRPNADSSGGTCVTVAAIGPVPLASPAKTPRAETRQRRCAHEVHRTGRHGRLRRRTRRTARTETLLKARGTDDMTPPGGSGPGLNPSDRGRAGSNPPRVPTGMHW